MIDRVRSSATALMTLRFQRQPVLRLGYSGLRCVPRSLRDTVAGWQNRLGLIFRDHRVDLTRAAVLEKACVTSFADGDPRPAQGTLAGGNCQKLLRGGWIAHTDNHRRLWTDYDRHRGLHRPLYAEFGRRYAFQCWYAPVLRLNRSGF